MCLALLLFPFPSLNTGDFLWYKLIRYHFPWPGMKAHACNPSTLGGWGRRITWAPGGSILAWATWQNPVSTKNTKKLARHNGTCVKSQLFRELRWEDCLSPGGQGYSELWSHHYTLAWAMGQDFVPTTPQKTEIRKLLCWVHLIASRQPYAIPDLEHVCLVN